MNFENPHTRLNPLTGEWILVSPHRCKRPWQGAVATGAKEEAPAYDPNCYLCPGNKRAGGVLNPNYRDIFIFANDYPALLQEIPDAGNEGSLWRQAKSERGICRVICYSPLHNKNFEDLELTAARKVVDDCWIKQEEELMGFDYINFVQIFENKLMGNSNPHPHGQIWAGSGLPAELGKEDRSQADFFKVNGHCLLCQVIKDELQSAERIIFKNEHWLALIPFWAIWPFEILLLPRMHHASLLELAAAQKDTLVEIWQNIIRQYNLLFQTTMPFSCGWHVMPKKSGQSLYNQNPLIPL
ncbi:galactose-1-phosphate uridylyltransferase, partial [Candidatus Riflebacteria bacterium]